MRYQSLVDADQEPYLLRVGDVQGLKITLKLMDFRQVTNHIPTGNKHLL
jgi:hypothetical protein